MTGYESKRAAARDKLEKWDMPSEAFNAWWDSDYDDSTNPYEKDTFAYWAWAGWKAALAQPAQEPVAWMNPSWIDPDTRGWQSESFESIPIEGWLPIYTAPPQCTVQVSPLEFVEMVMDKEHLVGNPIVWAQWPNKEKNNG
jgi:hypothetical protein